MSFVFLTCFKFHCAWESQNVHILYYLEALRSCWHQHQVICITQTGTEQPHKLWAWFGIQHWFKNYNIQSKQERTHGTFFQTLDSRTNIPIRPQGVLSQTLPMESNASSMRPWMPRSSSDSTGVFEIVTIAFLKSTKQQYTALHLGFVKCVHEYQSVIYAMMLLSEASLTLGSAAFLLSPSLQLGMKQCSIELGQHLHQCYASVITIV